MPLCKQLYLIPNNTVVKLGILQGKQAVHITDVIIRGHLCKLFTKNREPCLIVSLYKFPQCQAILKMLVFQDCIGADNRRANKVSTHFLHKGRGKIRGNRLIDTANAIHSRGKLRVQISIGLSFCTLER